MRLAHTATAVAHLVAPEQRVSSCHVMIGQPGPAKITMKPTGGWRDKRTGRVFGFVSETQREDFMTARARFCDGPNRLMPRCTPKSLGRPVQSSAGCGPVDLLSARWSRRSETSPARRSAPLWRLGPHPARRDAVRAQPAARPLAARSARARPDDCADRRRRSDLSSLGSAAWLPARCCRPRLPGVLRCVSMDLGRGCYAV